MAPRRPEEARRFLTKDSPRGATIRALLGALLGAAATIPVLHDRAGILVILSVASFLGLCVFALLAWLFPPAKVHVFVGVDGVTVYGRFVSYADIEGVREEWRHRQEGSDGMMAWSEADICTMHLDLRGGESIYLRTFEHGAPLVRAIEAGQAAWLAGYRGLSPAQEEMIARGERTTSDWAASLRRLGNGAENGYRSSPIDLEELSRALADPSIKPSRRAAAALVLGAAGDRTAAEKLRFAAADLAEPKLRIALETVAEAADEAAIAEALDALESADRSREPARSG